jgi:hypothetical protein
MIKIPTNKIIERHGYSYYMELKHIIRIQQRYNITTDRTALNKKYNIKLCKKIL